MNKELEQMAESYDAPKSARNNAKKVLRWREEHGDEVKGMTATGWRRASQLASGDRLSADVVKRMAQFNRHRKNAEVAPEFKDTPWKDNGHVAWLGWGGTTGVDWAIDVSASLNNETIQYVTLLSEASDIEILKVGEIQGRGLTITEAMLDDFVENFYSNAYGTELQVNLGHNREGEAAGWIKEVYKENGSLKAKVEWTPLGVEKIKSKQFRYTSSELELRRQHFETGKTVNNVLIGVGLTNIPAVKGMQALTLSEEVQTDIILTESMDKIKKMYAELMKKEKMSNADFNTFKEACADYMEEEEVKEMMSKVSGRMNNSEAETVDNNKDNSMNLSDELKKQGLVALTEEKLAELTASAEAGRKAAEELTKKSLSEEVESNLCLSEERSVGFKKADAKSVADFMFSLSEEQRTQFKDIVGKILHVELGEKGRTLEPTAKTEEALLSEADKRAHEIAKEQGIELSEALSIAYKELNLV
jgi:hypothetical protein